MELKEKIIKKYKRNVKEAEAKLERAKNELNKSIENNTLVARVVGNIERLRTMNDFRVREYNLPRITVSDHYDLIFIRDINESGSKCIADCEITRRFDYIRNLLVSKHDGIYNIQYGGEIGSVNSRSLKEDHSAEEFDDQVWKVLEKWIWQYRNRKMGENLYNAVMNDDFDILYNRLVLEKSPEL